MLKRLIAIVAVYTFCTSAFAASPLSPLSPRIKWGAMAPLFPSAVDGPSTPCPSARGCPWGVLASGSWGNFHVDSSGNLLVAAGGSPTSPSVSCPTFGGCPYAVNPSGTFVNLSVDSDGNLLVSLTGGSSSSPAVSASGTQLLYNASLTPTGTPGFTWNETSKVPVFALGAITTDINPFSQTWAYNNGAVAFGGEKTVVTNTASAAGSLIRQWCVASSCLTFDTSLSISTPGNVAVGAGSSVAGSLALRNGTAQSLPTNAFSIFAPTTITTSYARRVAAAENGSAGILHVSAAASHISDESVSAVNLANADVTGTLPVANGGTGLASYSAHQVPVATGSTTIAAKTVPDCTDTGGNHLNFTQSTDAFSCGTSGGSGGGVSLLNYQSQLTAVTGNSAMQSLFIYNVAQNIPAAGKCIRVRAMFHHTTGTTSTSYNWSYTAHSAALAGSGTALASTSTNQIDTPVLICNNVGVTNAQQINQSPWVAGNSVATGGVTTTAVDTTAAGGTDVSITFNVANTNAVTPDMFIVESLP